LVGKNLLILLQRSGKKVGERGGRAKIPISPQTTRKEHSEMGIEKEVQPRGAATGRGKKCVSEFAKKRRKGLNDHFIGKGGRRVSANIAWALESRRCGPPKIKHEGWGW